MRWLCVTLGVALGSLSCAGFHEVERGDWKLVYEDSAKRDIAAPREVVTRDTYEAEVSGGTRRGFEPPPGFVFPLLHETEAIGMTTGEVQAFRVNEANATELFLDGSTVELYWGQLEKRDEWKVDTDVTVRESALYVKAKKPGPAVLRLVRGSVTKDIPVTVK